VVDVVKTDVSCKPLEEGRKIIEGTPFDGRFKIVPRFSLLPTFPLKTGPLES
jgi:hypothetical protein